MVYDNYNALVIGYSPTERPSDAVLSLVIFPKRVSVCFIQGKHLPDPDGVLQGNGNQVRFIRLDRARRDSRYAAAQGAPVGGGRVRRHAVRRPRQLVIRAISKKQRPRR